jgi:hypothetical protein
MPEIKISPQMDMSHFLLVFILLYLNYALGGWILFGPHMEEWNTYTKSMSTTLQVK